LVVDGKPVPLDMNDLGEIDLGEPGQDIEITTEYDAQLVEEADSGRLLSVRDPHEFL